MSEVAVKDKNLPLGWAEASLVQVATISTGKRDANHAENNGAYTFFTCAFEPLKADTFAFDDEALLLPGNGHNVGEVFYYKGKFEAYQRTYVIHEIKLLPKYLFYNLKYGWRKATDQKQYGTATNYIRIGNFHDYRLPVAPLKQQKRIVAKIEELFSHIDAGIASLNKAKQLLKQYRQSVLKAAVTGELTKEWREQNKGRLEPASKLLERILIERRQKWEAQQLEQFKAKGKMPKDDKWKRKYMEPEAYSGGGYNTSDDWVMARAEQVCDLITKGTTPKKERLSAGSGEVPFIKVYNLTFDTNLNFGLKPTYTDKATHNDFLARSKVYPDDVLMNIVGPPLGKVSIVPDIHKEWNINQAIAIYRPLNGLSNKLLAYFLLSRPVVDWMQSKTKTTAGQVNLTLEISRNAPIPIPSEKEQIEMVGLIEQKLSSSDRMIGAIEVQLIKAEKNRQSILASAFSGRLA